MSNFLEVNSKLLENNLVITSDLRGDVDNFENLLRCSADVRPAENVPWKYVTPKPGCCLKTRDHSGNKVFVNICQLDDIPEPKEITESELLELWQSEETSDYRIPLSIQDPHDELDKSGKPTVVYDVAINTNFFSKISKNMIWHSFVVQVILEGVQNKYDLSLDREEYVILQNRKCLGLLKPHRIKVHSGPYAPPKRLIEELPMTKKPVPPVENDVVKGSGNNGTKPRFRFFKNIQKLCLMGEIHLPNIITPKDVTVHMGQGRLMLESERGYSLDLFIPANIDEDNVKANFGGRSKILTIYMPMVNA